MTIEQACNELFQSDEYKELCKGNDSIAGKHRLYLSRFTKGNLKTGAMVELLISNGYEINANKATKSKKK